MSLPAFPLESLGLSAAQLKKCRDANLAVAADLLIPSIADLNRKLRYTRIQEAQDLVKQISRNITPALVSLSSLLEHNIDVEGENDGRSDGDWVSTGDASLDEALGGGLRVGTITELSGESASGKSHFCLMTALAAQIPALTIRPGGTLILTSERDISTDRLHGLGQYMLAVHEPNGRRAPSDLLDHILTHSVDNITRLEHALNYKIPHILSARNGSSQAHAAGGVAERLGLLLQPIRLLIIDSITALIRGAEGNYANSTSMGLTERSRHLCAVADRLKHLATEYGLAVLVINQVSDVFARQPVQSSTPTAPSSSQMLSQFYTDGPEPPMLYATQSRWFSGQTATLQKEASLGIVWANAINVRVMLSQTKRRRNLGVQDLKRKKKRLKGIVPGAATSEDEPDTVDPVVDDTARILIRRAQVVFSPFAPPATVDFVITETGIHSLFDSYRLVDVAEMARRRGRIARALVLKNGDDEDSLPSRSSQLPPDTQAAPQEEFEDMAPDEERNAADTHDSDDYDELGPIPDDLWDAMGSRPPNLADGSEA